MKLISNNAGRYLMDERNAQVALPKGEVLLGYDVSCESIALIFESGNAMVLQVLDREGPYVKTLSSMNDLDDMHLYLIDRLANEAKEEYGIEFDLTAVDAENKRREIENNAGRLVEYIIQRVLFEGVTEEIRNSAYHDRYQFLEIAKLAVIVYPDPIKFFTEQIFETLDGGSAIQALFAGRIEDVSREAIKDYETFLGH